MPIGGRAGFAGGAVLNQRLQGDLRPLDAASTYLRHRLRCRLEAVPALPVGPSKPTVARRSAAARCGEHLPEASLAMPIGGRAGFAGGAVLNQRLQGDLRPLDAASTYLRHRLRCRLEAVPALPVGPSKPTVARRSAAARCGEHLPEASLAMPI